eukprot:CAMPEP_0181229694 /NCGR_PEP_ID=MMETSP1096-20121128/34045_1 /TAXON_ID=156174 ORGANISM="Chrysochromulina ericina, Strain CCMP281" /NCGR_SAMPLE_ID=MMETSP1096 /ASSEMBLY_ACC=CAM_ASM_000453 /LENGTH=102 /DNA_ID=CAMNT_0023323357 /DNA_START=137 /DNA_END=446 /DNA_ORIENTATION=-
MDMYTAWKYGADMSVLAAVAVTRFPASSALPHRGSQLRCRLFLHLVRRAPQAVQTDIRPTAHRLQLLVGYNDTGANSQMSAAYLGEISQHVADGRPCGAVAE